jgi:dethiobiotin synthetase
MSTKNDGRGTLVIVTGTGTSIGKTHFAEALILAWGRTARVVGLKPIESGVVGGVETDGERLRAVSSFHVKPFGYRLAAPLSPHLAARYENIEIRVQAIAKSMDEARRQADGVVTELAGGLFTPIADDACNVDLARTLAPDSILLVAPDRLGVLHDVIASVRAASAASMPIEGVVLMAPEQPDQSTGRNAAELTRAGGISVLAVFPRGSPAELSELQAMMQLVGVIARR